MKRLLICSFFVLISAVLSYGQCIGNCTAVTAGLTDSTTQQWPNATVTINLVRPFGNPAPVLNNGVPVNSPINTVLTNGSGVFTVSLDDTTKLTPSGALWQFTMCPNASVSNCSQVTTSVFGATQNLTTLLSNALNVPVVNATPALTRVYNNNEANGSQGTLIWNTITNLIYGCNAIPCSSNWVQVAGSASNFASPPSLGNVAPNSVAATTLSATGNSTLTTISATCISTNNVIDVACAGVGADGAAKIQSVINNVTACPVLQGCTISLVNMSGTDLVWLSNPAHGPNRGISFILGSKTYIACVPIVDGQTGYTWSGPDASPNISATFAYGGAVILAGTAALGCPGNFPNGATSTITTTWPHGALPAGTYTALMNRCGNTTTDNPIGTADCFGGWMQHIQLNCNNLAGCTHNYFSAAEEERAGMFDVPMVGAGVGCGNWDRSYQPGPPSPGGSGPVHFEVHYGTCVPGTQATNNQFIPYNIEMNTTYISFSGQSGCSTTSNPAATGIPTAYTTMNFSGVPQAPTLTNAGNCTTPPTGCNLNVTASAGGSGNVCAVTTSGNNVATISFSTAGTNYPTAQVPGGGPRFSNITVVGNTGIQVNDVFAIEGDYNTHIYDIHTQNVHGSIVHHGLGSAPYWSGEMEELDITIGGDAGSSVLHCGVGSLDNLCTGQALNRNISSGDVVIDDPNNVILATTDNPSHAFIPLYPLPLRVYSNTGGAVLPNQTQGFESHFVYFAQALSGGTATVTLSNGARYSASNSYACSCSDTTTNANSCTARATSGTSVILAGTGTDTVAIQCTGN